MSNYKSQFGQDKHIIENIFKGKKNLFFIETGASDGINISNTYILEKEYNWNGLCIEPNSFFYKKLVDNRRCHTSNELLYSSSGLELEFTNYSYLGGIKKHLRSKILDKNLEYIKKTTTTLTDELDKINAPSIINYFSLDTEGSEYEILKGINFDKYQFNYISIETNKDTQKLDLITTLLKKHNYVIYRKHKVDVDFIHLDTYNKL